MMVLKIVNMALLMAVSVVLARALGPERFGTYSYALAVISLLGLPVHGGLPTLLIREVAAYLARGQYARLKGLVVRANQAVAISAAMVGLFAALTVYFARPSPDTEQMSTFLIGFILLPVLALGKIRGAVLTGLSRVLQGQLPEFLVTPGVLLLLVFSVSRFGWAASPSQVMGLHVVAAAVAYVVGQWLLVANTPWEVKQAGKEYEDRAWLRSTLPLALIAGMSVLNSQMDITMLGMMTSSANVGIYRVAAQGAAVLSFGIMAINAVIAPHISRLYAVGDMRRLQTMIRATTRISLGVTVAVQAVLALGGRQLIALTFGPAYEASYAPMMILAVGQVCVVALGSTMTVATMTGHERSASRIMVVGLVVNVGLNLLLIPSYGPIGAAISSVVSLIIWRLMLFGRVRSWVGIDTSVVGVYRPSARGAVVKPISVS